MVRATSRIVLIAICTLLAVEGAAAATCAANQYVSSNVCTNCPGGYARAAGDDSTGADTACLLCAENYYVSAKGADATTAGTCSTCGTGRANPAGADSTSTGTKFTAANKGCLSCLKDFYLSVKGADATTAGTCTACTGKSYIAAGTATSAGTVNRCLFRKCSENQYVSNGECMNCPTGLGRDAGDDSSLGVDTMCDKCLAGYALKTAGTDTTMGECEACPSGQTSGATTSSLKGQTPVAAAKHCQKCKAGYYLKTAATDGDGAGIECITCDAGTTGLWSAEVSAEDDATATTLAKGCQKCAAGYYLKTRATDGDGASIECKTCDAGTTGLWSAVVSAEDDGTATSLAKGCQKCAAGYYVKTKATDGDGAGISCLTCGTAGKTSDVTGAEDGDAEFASVDKGCLKVAANYYVSAVGADATTAGTVAACATGTTNAAGDVSTRAAGSLNPSGTGMTSATTQCDDRVAAFAKTPACLVNQRVLSHACVPCPAGYARAAGDVPSGADTTCTLCAAGYRVATKGSDATTAGTCTVCAARTTTASADSTSTGTVVAACLSCAADHYVSAKGADATTAGTCTACASGTAKKGAASVNAAGDLSTSAGAVTTCDSAVCASSAFASTTVGCASCAARASA